MLSRVADALYWLGRYTERAEHITRLLLVTDDFASEAMRLDETVAQTAWKDLLAIFPAAQLTRDTPQYAPLTLPHLLSFFANARNGYSVSFSVRRLPFRLRVAAAEEVVALDLPVFTEVPVRRLERPPTADEAAAAAQQQQ